MKALISIILLTVGLTLSCNLILAQKINESESIILANSFSGKGVNFYYSNNLDSAIYYTEKACEIYEREDAWQHHVCALNNLAAFYHTDNRLGSDLNELTLKSFEVAKAHLKSSNSCFIDALANIHNHYYNIGDFEKAIEIFNEVLVLRKTNNASKLESATAYSNLGNFYKLSGDYQNAFSFFKKTLKLQSDSIPNEPIIAETFNDIGRVFYLNNQLDSAIYYFEKGEQILKSVDSKDPLYNKKIENIIQLAEYQAQAGNIQKSNFYIDQISRFPLSPYYQVRLREGLGRIYIIQKNYSKAIDAFEKGELIAQEKNVRTSSIQMAKRLVPLGDAYYALPNYNKALETYQTFLTSVSPTFKKTDFRFNPKASELLSKPDALSALNGKARTLQKLYIQTSDSIYLNSAYNTYITTTNLIRDMRQGFLNSEAKNTLAEKSIPIYEGAIQTALELYRISKKEAYKEEALSLAESNKALLLLESINEQHAKGFANIPDSLLDIEKDLKLNIAYLEKKALEKTNAKSINEDIFDLRLQLDQLTTNLEKNYPRYFDLKYQNDPVDLKIIQQELTINNSALFEYFVGEEATYLFIVTPSNLDIKVIPESDVVFKAVQQLRSALNTPPGKLAAIKEYTEFTSVAYELFFVLLQPALVTLPPDISAITIIPDYHLNYIPFDVLLMEAVNIEQPGYSPATLEYVMEKYQISYHYSATLLHKNKQRKKRTYKQGFIGFAPTFNEANSTTSRSCTADEMYSLQCSEEEVSTISNLLSGVFYSGIEANKETFEQDASSYRIIHLATHACVDENNAAASKIFLTNDFLSNFDLYNMDLSADLAVLSACNTGSGKLIKGEGVMSLARGFINAGCSSTMMSMWSVDDCATSDIMVRTYEGLKKGLQKDAALRDAKLGYLNSVNKAKSHPYYWAAFVQFGDTTPMKFKASFNWKYLIGALAIASLFLFMFSRRKS